MTLDMIDDSIRHGAVVGDPDDALVQVKRWEAAGVDQFCLGVGTATKDQMMETIRLFGEHIIPKIDTDPMHRTARMRQAATG
jgi:alkanesulfonate monooxygenase SsuD/methylene tetrahydromethanopterin reductase-like flavin-dependent oxidoreductase (luciferase family)